MGNKLKRLYYFGAIATEAYMKKSNTRAYAGAATRKMCQLVSAMRLVGYQATIVSLPFVFEGSIFQHKVITRENGSSAIFLPTSVNYLLRRIIGLFTYAWFSLVCIKSSDKVIIYNHSLESILALIVLKIKCVNVFQDIEDVPTRSNLRIKGYLELLGFYLVFLLTSRKKITVSYQIGNNLRIKSYLAIHGFAAAAPEPSVLSKWTELENGAPIRIHYGGSLMAETGLNIFIKTIGFLHQNDSVLKRKVEFIVTGTGNLDEIYSLSSSIESEKLSIRIFKESNSDLYLRLLLSCHASLSLKLPLSEFADTTFPSKVIEITSNGLALIATKISDVGEIFDSETAYLLKDATAQCLTNIILNILDDPIRLQKIAASGQAVSKSRFSSDQIGLSIANFIETT